MLKTSAADRQPGKVVGQTRLVAQTAAVGEPDTQNSGSLRLLKARKGRRHCAFSRCRPAVPVKNAAGKGHWTS